MDGPADPKAAYEQARKDLITALHKKRAVDKSLVCISSLFLIVATLNSPYSPQPQALIEQNLYNFEANYLAETSMSGGNIITGFDSYLKPSAASKKRHEITEADRIFSNSSDSITRVSRAIHIPSVIHTEPMCLNVAQFGLLRLLPLVVP